MGGDRVDQGCDVSHSSSRDAVHLRIGVDEKQLACVNTSMSFARRTPSIVLRGILTLLPYCR